MNFRRGCLRWRAAWKTVAEGREPAAEMIASGRAKEKFRELIGLQGGDARIVDDPARLPRAQHQAKVTASQTGYVAAIRCEQVGVASMLLGGGREKKEDAIDPAVGLVLERKVGEAVQNGETLCTVHYNDDRKAREALNF